MRIESKCLHKHTSVLYSGKAKKRLVKAAMRKARRHAEARGIKVESVAAYKKCGYGTRNGYFRQYKL